MSIIDMRAHHIEGGRMMQMLDNLIAKVGREVIQAYNDGAVKQPSGKVAVQITIEKDPEIIDDYRITYQMGYSLKKVTGAARCVGNKGILQCNHRGADHENPMQESLLDQIEEENSNE